MRTKIKLRSHQPLIYFSINKGPTKEPIFKLFDNKYLLLLITNIIFTLNEVSIQSRGPFHETYFDKKCRKSKGLIDRKNVQ